MLLARVDSFKPVIELSFRELHIYAALAAARVLRTWKRA